jgi:hypothetical protein
MLGKHIPAATDTYVTKERLMGVVFYMRNRHRNYKRLKLGGDQAYDFSAD